MTTTTTPEARRLPAELRRAGRDLLHQQCWCWGCDIRRQAGNLLLEYGFARRRPPAAMTGSSLYTCACGAGRVAALWGFGLFYGDPVRGGLFLRRFEFTPRWLPALDLESPPWLPARVATRDPARDQELWQPALLLLSEAAGWVAAYEAWVASAQGQTYRQSCLDGWVYGRVGRPTPPAQLPAAWHGLAARCAGLAEAAPAGCA
ncbi:MAG TPA: hypothetical protein VFS21_25565 [Roseiflexaceae bacterium]|nr:hypothetical protein [Roseiflexaceae bacterium]